MAKKSKKTAAPVGEKKEQVEPGAPEAPIAAVSEDVKLENPDDKKQEEREAKKEEAKHKMCADCRLCLYYPFASSAMTTTMSESMLRVTHHFTKTFCGEHPWKKDKTIVPELNCVGKAFKPLKSVR